MQIVKVGSVALYFIRWYLARLELSIVVILDLCVRIIGSVLEGIVSRTVIIIWWLI